MTDIPCRQTEPGMPMPRASCAPSGRIRTWNWWAYSSRTRRGGARWPRWTPLSDVHWFGSESEMLEDAGIAAIASEGPTYQSLDQTERCVQAGKHVWYDKPAGDNWPQWQRTIALAEQRGLTIQMGYMFRYHAGFRQIEAWVKSGFLGDIYAIRARIGTVIGEGVAQRVELSSRRRLLRVGLPCGGPGRMAAGPTAEGDRVSAQ